MKRKYLKDEQGIVLLSCLVFLLLILGIVRFSLTSSRLEERKAGVDYEMLTARQSAQTAIRYAENFILEQGIAYCEKGLTKSSDPSEVQRARAVCGGQNRAYLANMLWSDKNLNNAFMKIGQDQLINKGIYMGSDIKKNYLDCKPFWSCINWGDDAKIVRSTSNQLGNSVKTDLVSIECDKCETLSSIKPRYIIERFTSEDISSLKYSNDKNLDLNDSGVVILRITAVGFGNGKGGNGVSITNAVMQATYIL